MVRGSNPLGNVMKKILNPYMLPKVLGYSYARTVRASKYSWFNRIDEEVKKGNIMLNNKTFIAIASAGFATQIFAYLCGSQLNTQTLANFNAFGSVAIFAAFLGYAINTMNELSKIRNDIESVSEDTRRDFDNVYRYVDDCNRDVRTDITDMERNFNAMNDKRKR